MSRRAHSRNLQVAAAAGISPIDGRTEACSVSDELPQRIARPQGLHLRQATQRPCARDEHDLSILGIPVCCGEDGLDGTNSDLTRVESILAWSGGRHMCPRSVRTPIANAASSGSVTVFRNRRAPQTTAYAPRCMNDWIDYAPGPARTRIRVLVSVRLDRQIQLAVV